jgi:DNA-binding winged helix-turn-helix (wHTH) protein/Tfp pilus assembly protein PilF
MQEWQKKFYEFGAFRLEVKERLLLRHGEPVHLQAKAFDTLLALVQNSGHLLTKEELLEKVWADSFVEENNLTKNIYALRKALNGNGEEFIETVPRQGYRFRAEVCEGQETENLLIENRTKFRLVVKEEITESTPRKKTLIFSILLIAVLVSAIGFAVNKYWKAENQPHAEAYENYQKGRALWQTRTGENLHQATLLLEAAVQKDPNFALAHAALADAYVFDYANWKKAESEANEALRLNPNLGEPHATLGFIRMFWEWKLYEAEKEFKQAVRLSPNYATAHQWFALNLAATGHTDGALTEMTRALELEPNSVPINADLCQMLYFKRKYDKALVQCQKTLTMDANFINTYRYLYEIYLAQKRWDEAVSTYFRIEELSNFGSLPNDLKKLKEAYARGGIREFWQTQTETLSRPVVQPYKLAQTYSRLGERDKALYWLNEVYKNRDFDFVMVASDPIFFEFHDDQDFFALMTKFLPKEN